MLKKDGPKPVIWLITYFVPINLAAIPPYIDGFIEKWWIIIGLYFMYKKNKLKIVIISRIGFSEPLNKSNLWDLIKNFFILLWYLSLGDNKISL